jgi:predicted lipase
VYNDTKEEITKLVKSLAKKNPKYTIVNVGHSLGGSLAVFQTLDLLAAGLPAKRLMTFTYGQPRTGNDVFAKHVESLPIRLFRVVNKNDIIPQIPPVQFGYAHTVPEYWITPSNEVVKCQKLGGNNCSASQGINLTIVRHAKYFDTAFLLPCLVK